jgi:hypothetical protein
VTDDAAIHLSHHRDPDVPALPQRVDQARFVLATECIVVGLTDCRVVGGRFGPDDRDQRSASACKSALRGLLLGIASRRTDTERTQHSRKTFGRTARISVTTNVSDSSDLSQIHQTPETPRPIEELMPWIVGKA